MVVLSARPFSRRKLSDGEFLLYPQFHHWEPASGCNTKERSKTKKRWVVQSLRWRVISRGFSRFRKRRVLYIVLSRANQLSIRRAFAFLFFFFSPVLSAGHSRRTRERKEGKRKAYMRKPRGDAERWSVRLPSGLGWNVSRANNPSGTRPSPARLERCFTAVHGCDARKRALRKIRPRR